MKIKIFCRCACFLPGSAKDLSALLYETARFSLVLCDCETVFCFQHSCTYMDNMWEKLEMSNKEGERANYI